MIPLRHRTLQHAALWSGAVLVGVLAVLYAKAFTTVQTFFFRCFSAHPWETSVASVFLFVAAAALTHFFGPQAKGSGIPQVLEAIDLAKREPERAWDTTLVSVRTAAVKVISSVVGLFGGASIGREGPTVQIASSGFAWMARKFRSRVPELDFSSYLVAGASAGVAAAFNAPLAGITFALEEIAESAFASFKQTVMLAIIISGVTAQAILGDYLYFGHPAVSAAALEVVPKALLIGLIGGLGGGAFARLLTYSTWKRHLFFNHRARLPWYARAFLCGLVCAGIGFFTHGATAGSGYEITRRNLDSSSASLSGVHVLFPALKFSTTVLSYLSGMAGGIFSPSLSIGAGLGMSVAKIAHFMDFKICALLGMVAFFSGAIQAPLTGVVIVMEMTDEHRLIIPFMIAAFLAHAAGKVVQAEPLYHYLAFHKPLESKAGVG